MEIFELASREAAGWNPPDVRDLVILQCHSPRYHVVVLNSLETFALPLQLPESCLVLNGQAFSLVLLFLDLVLFPFLLQCPKRWFGESRACLLLALLDPV